MVDHQSADRRTDRQTDGRTDTQCRSWSRLADVTVHVYIYVTVKLCCTSPLRSSRSVIICQSIIVISVVPLAPLPGIDHLPDGRTASSTTDPAVRSVETLTGRRWTAGRCPGPNQSLSRSTASARRLTDAGVGTVARRVDSDVDRGEYQ